MTLASPQSLLQESIQHQQLCHPWVGSTEFVCTILVVCQLITGKLSALFKGNYTSNLPFETISRLQLGCPCGSLGNHVSIPHRGDCHNHKPWCTTTSQQMPTSLVSLEPPKLKTPGELGQNPWMMLSKGVSLKHDQGKETLLQACNCGSEGIYSRHVQSLP